MVKQKRNVKNEEKVWKEISDFEELPENIQETLVFIGSGAKILVLNEIKPAAFSGRYGDFIFNLVYDPLEEIDEEMFRSAILEIMNKSDPFADKHEKENNV